MIKEIIEAISIALNEEFGDSYTIYTENVKQGLKTPCFFVLCINPTNKIFRGKRYLSANQMCVQYLPVNTDNEREECNSIAERLFECLEYITVGGDLIRGKDMSSEMSDGIFNFFVNYDFFTIRKEEMEPMKEISGNISVKG